MNFLSSKVTSGESALHASTEYKIHVYNFPTAWDIYDLKKFLGKKFYFKKFKKFKQHQKNKFIVTTESFGSLQLALAKNGAEVEGVALKIVQVGSETSKDLKSAEHKSEETKANEVVNKTAEIIDTGRLFVKNLPYTLTENELESVFAKHGEVVETSIPINYDTNESMGYGFVTFLLPESALKAYEALNGTSLKGRTLHVAAAWEPTSKPKFEKSDSGQNQEFKTTYQKKKGEEMKDMSMKSYNWNSLFIGSNTVADSLSNQYGMRKQEILSAEGKDASLPVRIALGETRLVNETRQFLLDHGVNLDAFSQAVGKRSKTVILAKNLPVSTSKQELEDVFTKNAPIDQVVLPPSGLSALVTFKTQADAKKAFLRLAYTKFKGTPLYLEWAPVDCFDPEKLLKIQNERNRKDEVAETATEQNQNADVVGSEELPENACVFVKNISFDTTESSLKEAFSRFEDSIDSAMIATHKKGDVVLSRGYGFIQFKSNESAMEAIKTMQGKLVDGHAVELKLSNRPSNNPKSSRLNNQRTKETDEVSTCKILVKNIPFEVKEKELKQLFSTFGQVKFLRLPKKMAGEVSFLPCCIVNFITNSPKI